MELVEVGPSMDLVVRRHRLPNEGLRKEAMRTSKDQPKKKIKNVSSDAIEGTIGKIYIPDQNVGDAALPNKAVKLRRETLRNVHQKSKRKNLGKPFALYAMAFDSLKGIEYSVCAIVFAPRLAIF